MIITFLWFQIMSDENKQPFGLEEDPDLNLNDNEVFQEENQWINELRLALERGCDLGSIRTIGKCRPLTDDLRLSVWKVSRNMIFFDNVERMDLNKYLWSTKHYCRRQN